MAKKTRGYSPPIYKAYLFKEKDPVIDELRTMAQDHYGDLSGKHLMEIETGGGPKVSTMRSWFFGKTRRPTNATIEAAGRSIGWERAWRKRKG
jgi:hypothetical protein